MLIKFQVISVNPYTILQVGNPSLLHIYYTDKKHEPQKFKELVQGHRANQCESQISCFSQGNKWVQLYSIKTTQNRTKYCQRTSENLVLFLLVPEVDRKVNTPTCTFFRKYLFIFINNEKVHTFSVSGEKKKQLSAPQKYNQIYLESYTLRSGCFLRYLSVHLPHFQMTKLSPRDLKGLDQCHSF